MSALSQNVICTELLKRSCTELQFLDLEIVLGFFSKQKNVNDVAIAQSVLVTSFAFLLLPVFWLMKFYPHLNIRADKLQICLVECLA